MYVILSKAHHRSLQFYCWKQRKHLQLGDDSKHVLCDFNCSITTTYWPICLQTSVLKTLCNPTR